MVGLRQWRMPTRRNVQYCNCPKQEIPYTKDINLGLQSGEF